MPGCRCLGRQVQRHLGCAERIAAANVGMFNRMQLQRLSLLATLQEDLTHSRAILAPLPTLPICGSSPAPLSHPSPLVHPFNCNNKDHVQSSWNRRHTLPSHLQDLLGAGGGHGSALLASGALGSIPHPSGEVRRREKKSSGSEDPRVGLQVMFGFPWGDFSPLFRTWLSVTSLALGLLLC